MKTAIAVIVGFVVWTVLFLGGNQVLMAMAPDHFSEDGSIQSTAILLLTLALTILYSVASGWVAAKTAKTGTNLPAKLLGGLLLLVGLAVQISYWDVVPLWYNLLFLGFLFPATVFGGQLVTGRAS